MSQCWHKDPEQRPTFQEMKDTLMTLLEQATEGYGYLALLKTSENYRVISEIAEDERRDSIDEVRWLWFPASMFYSSIRMVLWVLIGQNKLKMGSVMHLQRIPSIPKFILK